jgi:hypothetical protein
MARTDTPGSRASVLGGLTTPARPSRSRYGPNRNFRTSGSARNAKNRAPRTRHRTACRKYGNATAAPQILSIGNRRRHFDASENSRRSGTEDRSSRCGSPLLARQHTQSLVRRQDSGVLGLWRRLENTYLIRGSARLHTHFRARRYTLAYSVHHDRAIAAMIRANASTSRVSITSAGECE